MGTATASRRAGTSARALRSALQGALSADARLSDRLSHAGCSISFAVEGAADETVTLLLDRRPVELVDGDSGDIEVVLDPGDAERFATGELPLITAVVLGDVRTSGPLRSYLEVDPVLRRALARQAGAPPHPARATAVRSEATIDPDLCAIETRDLHKSFGDNGVLCGLNLSIPEGVIAVVLGPSGTGKSVLLQHVIGLMRPDRGDVLIRGRALSTMSRGEVLSQRRDIGVMFQDGALFSAMNVYDNVAFPLRQHTDLVESEVREVVQEHLDSVGLASAAQLMPNQLSGGMRKRAGLARALVLEPGIVLCDEPDSGLDPVRTALLADLLVAQHAQYGGTMVVVTHNVMLARQIGDHMSILWRGETLASGLSEQVLASDMPFVQQFLAGAPQGPLGMDA